MPPYTETEKLPNMQNTVETGKHLPSTRDELLAAADHMRDEVFFPVPVKQQGWPTPHIDSLEKYNQMYHSSINQPETFFGNLARELLHWSKPFTTVVSGSLAEGDVTWFQDGELNATYNCVDRHALSTPDKIAIVFEADEPGNSEKISYRTLMQDVCRLANTLYALGLRKGDTVAIYMPMVPATIVAFLACARIGLVHSVVFAGFSAESLRDRIRDAGCSVVLTTDEGKRGGKRVSTKKIVDQALTECPSVKHVLVYAHTGANAVVTSMVKGRDLWWKEEVERQRPYCPPVAQNSEDPLFMLYTSGSTGLPKGVLHTTGGYLLGAAATTKYVFDYHEGDVFGCMADVGWITGHSYIVYGPLALGATTVLFESVPTYPDASRYWKLVAEHKVTQFYTAPTAIRALRRLGDKWVEGHDLSSLRILGSVGEPVNPEAWHWYNAVVGKGRCAIVDTYWQTETGSHVIAPLPGAIRTKPGSATVPFFGIDPVILNPHTGEVLEGNGVTGVLALKRPWPSMARTVYGDHKRYMATYMNVYPGYYFTGDGASRDGDGYIWIGGRVDDVINVSGHRLSTAEIESALILHDAVAEGAVVAVPDDLTGQAIVCFLTLKPGMPRPTGAELKGQVRKIIGPFATPKRCIIVDMDLPKTRSGKIMRRILRKIASGEADSLGDTSTLAEPDVIGHLIDRVNSPPLA